MHHASTLPLYYNNLYYQCINFHERVGESPRREKNFGTSGSKIRRFVSEIWPFEVGIGVRAD